MKYYKQGQLLCYIGTWMPFVILVTIFLFFYGVYMQTYLLPRIRSEYIEKPVIEINTYLIQLVHINDYVFSNSTVVITVLLHTILVLFLITLIRVVTTLPGKVPKEWLNRVEGEINKMIENEENMINFHKKGSQTSTSFSSEIDDEQRLQLNSKARLELIDKSGHRFCKELLGIQTKTLPSLPLMQDMLVENGSSLSMAQQLHRLQQLQNVHQFTRLFMVANKFYNDNLQSLLL
ncbi:unnamed protein product (macronuclear) [Paramecium tetraurelia]|uniref:Uncharacterized protein n=1 Tax=Paramecium tetraurelia TaxID=5888 RepID=A0CBY2_PARTE|nr:uncharacterized protein GSPATT00037083001 [Paramecium tetraurelia]CAK68299.1 unnamed protein product [Paramecium tetraurelia]|eukprot:XP_001435696.1 hypothetical protein (macronuclear) [Paramecium tetraurelia strain d4-2]